ncbi:MAG: PQQ-binding-like beta-propeller repeat protein [Phycisphaerae bacterium]|nr:MAG: PQQ-binding-like beta-propeller repeat protein [Phycisphaerae bacterium]MCK6464397.1 PQQ-binding-like beta-propeller repeat protein [Phycisphaerae bacterium]MCL4718051.1 PQQ-binding-like beta-propeller repeat protein [Phycisphaerae bacterium]NUQ07687.1 PQQ-binding-like beta-propeller repeat protein [Phycisphaerae bacterium]
MTSRLSRTITVLSLLASCGLRAAWAQDQVHPWPTWGRTTTRLGNTETFGPRTSNIDWAIQADFWVGESLIYSSCAMDAYGRVFQGQLRGVTTIDSFRREVLWTVEAEDLVDSSPTVYGDRVFWGVTALNGPLRCSDAETGAEMWKADAEWGFRVSPVFDPAGLIYFNDQKSNVYARRASDGAEVWTVMINANCFCPLALDPRHTLLGGKGSGIAALHPAEGSLPWEVNWVFQTSREVFGVVVIAADVVYIASSDRYLYAVSRSDGAQLWRFNCEDANRGALAIGHDGTIYTATSGSFGWLFAISPEGRELWRFRMRGLALNSPIVGGDGTIYATATNLDGNENLGYVHAVRPDGTELWTKQMPWSVVASPMLAPDGTLYVMCRDKFLYAFRDPAGDINYDEVIDLADYARFDECMTDPRLWGTKSNTSPGCELLDFDRDWDVDLADYAAFQNRMGTPAP